jgi:hypothetical protein
MQTWPELERAQQATPQEARRLLATRRYRGVIAVLGGWSGGIHFAIMPETDAKGMITERGKRSVEKLYLFLRCPDD